MAFLEIEGLRKSYGEHEVLRGIDLKVEQHEVICLIGASGSGKSTLLRCVNALEPIDGGQVRLDGEVVSGAGVDVNLLRRDVGMVFQSYNLFPHMSVLDNVTLAPIRLGGLSRERAAQKAMILLERVGLADKAASFPDRLSGGQQQRVAIVRTLAMEPRVLLLDEITAALDPELVAEVLGIVRELASEGLTMLLATHEMGFAREVADKVCFLHQGSLLEQGPPEKIFTDPAEERTRMFLKSIIAAGRL
ncbi:amino acid ABC transporter ATP-binding protein [Streptosporangium sp. NPDC000396]|uniref:amino acid ABC transporter ATP-binding protein n=1 Tax=Streptosporangium sp. NPDC000396 TaxID=3366185 RepID=UPI00368C2928